FDVSRSGIAMPATDTPAVITVHRLLFRALLELRSRGHEQKDKVVFHLADLFHNVVLEMENAAEGRSSYADVLRALEARASEKGLGQWLEHNLATLVVQRNALSCVPQRPLPSPLPPSLPPGAGAALARPPAP